MRLLLILLASCCAAISSKATPGCTVSEWGPFSEWRTPYHDDSVKSFPSRAIEGFDRGAETRAHLMRIKENRRLQKEQCKAEGSCPELNPRVDDGPFPCFGNSINGKLPCQNIEQLAYLSLETMTNSGGDGNDIWGWTDPQNGDEYALFGAYSGTAFVRITDPIYPVPVGFLPSHTGSSTWRDLKVIQDHVYIVSEATGHGVQVFDLTELRGVETWIEFAETNHYGALGNCHNIVANEETNFLYAVGCTSNSNGCGGGLHAIDVSVPFAPQEAGCFGGDGYVHDAQCVIYNGPDASYVGSEICFCYNEDTFTIVDVTDKENMFQISRTGYNNARYTHQGWVTEDHTLVLLDDELDEQQIDGIQKTYMWDVRNLASPMLQNTYVSGLNSVDHNQYIIGNLTYQANYESGLRILSIDQEAFTLQELAYFDVYPSGNSANFNGAWSVYPYFTSGNLIISSIDSGLYIVRPNIAAMREMQKHDVQMSERTRYRTILQAGDVSSCPNLVEIEHK